MAEGVLALPPPDDSKQFLLSLKEVLDNLKSHGDSGIQKEALLSLVSIYLKCPAKVSAKRVIASFFQNLDEELQCFIERHICEQLLQKICAEQENNGSVASTRDCVDCITAFMENFKMGEHCLKTIAMEVIKFLAQAQVNFLSQVHENVPPVHLNEVMHHCHVTIQTLNLVFQKIVAENDYLMEQILADSKLLTFIMDLNLQILKNELFLLDCRCCCAMNAFILLHLSQKTQEAAKQITSIIFPTMYGQRIYHTITWLTLEQEESLNMEAMPVLLYLALAFGYIAVAKPQCVAVEYKTGEHFFIDLLLPHLLSHGVKCTDTMSKALYGKTVQLWTSRLLSTVQSAVCSASLSGKFHPQSSCLNSLLDYVWTNMDDQLDVLRQSSKSVFENIIKIQSVVNSNESACDKLGSFMQSVMAHLFTVSWTSRGKFSALTSCVRVVGAQAVIDIRPGLPTEIVNQLREQALSCYASELYSTLFTSHMKELSVQSEQDDWRNMFLDTWAEPVVKVLLSSNKKQKQNVIEYLLSRLMKSDDQLLACMIQRLSSGTSDGADFFHGPIILCLRRAQLLGLLRPVLQTDSENCILYGCLHPEVLKAALCSSDEQIRLDAFALLCDSYRTTEVVTNLEFSMLRFFIPFNLNNQSPSFRQSFLSLLNKLFFRLKESLSALKRQAKKDKQLSTPTESIQHYDKFLHWLTDHLLYNLYPGSAFARRTTSLAVVSLMSTYFTKEQDGFSVHGSLGKQQLQALLECLADTFEENKKEALQVLTSYLAHGGIIWDKQGLEEIMEVSVSLSCSTRPQDGPTAAYNFILILKQLEHHPKHCNIAEILPLDLLQPSKASLLKEITNAALLLLSFLLALLDDQISVASESLITAAASRPMYPTLHCIRYLMQELGFRNISQDIVPEAREFIQHLIVSCLNLSRVVSPVVQNSSPEGNIPEAILGPGLNISSVLEPGILESEGEHRDQQTTKDQGICAGSYAVVESMPEYLVVCCWRSIKEVSLTLGKLCLQLPVTQILEECSGAVLLSLDQVKTIGEYFTAQLLESIHRGAFELAYAGFQLMCQMLWSHPAATFHQLPSHWLSDVMTNISHDPDSKLCSTRRSAGVPFFVQAVTSTEPAATGRKCFHGVMKELLALAVSQTEPDERQTAQISGQAQVHALNILRALFRDARLGEEVVPYVADGLKASILGFKSEQWAVRNSATLLLSALMTRMFGVKRSKDETSMSKKNCQTGRAFFHHYPSLYPFLLSELEEATADVGSKHRIHLSPSLYPVLLVLGRLFPSTLEGSDTSLSLSAFIPYVIRCAASPVYKTRVIASRALQPLARRDQVISISKQLFDILPESGMCQDFSSSHIHGSLLQLYQLAKIMKENAMSSEEDAQEIITSLHKRTWLISRTNRCFATMQAALVLIDIMLDVAAEFHHRSSAGLNGVTAELKEAFFSALMEDKAIAENTWQPLYYDLQKTKAKLSMKHLAEFHGKASGELVVSQDVTKLNCPNITGLCNGDGVDLSTCHTTALSGITAFESTDQAILLKLLSSPLYEVRQEVLDSLWAVWKADSNKVGTETLSSGVQRQDLSSGNSEATCADFYLSEGPSKTVIKDLAPVLFNEILKMVMETETHHECLQKAFSALTSNPRNADCLSEKDPTEILKIFTDLTWRMNREKRIEVKAAMMKFSGLLVPLVYSSIPSQPEDDNNDRPLTRLSEWVGLLKSGSSTDENPELQISCCQVLLENGRTLLCDPDSKLGSSTFVSWNSLAILLQEDDLEVKDIAASILCVVQGIRPGSYHPSYALHCLPSALLAIHGERNLSGVVTCLLDWILQDAEAELHDSSERLFDKGEMNVYRDQVAFTRSITESLAKALDLDLQNQFTTFFNTGVPETKVSSKVTTEEMKARCRKVDERLNISLTHSVSSLTNSLSLLSDNCQQMDVYLNNSRYMSLCQTVYGAQVVLCLFGREDLCGCTCTDKCVCDCTVRKAFLSLESLVFQVIRKFHLGNTLTS